MNKGKSFQLKELLKCNIKTYNNVYIVAAIEKYMVDFGIIIEDGFAGGSMVLLFKLITTAYFPMFVT